MNGSADTLITVWIICMIVGVLLAWFLRIEEVVLNFLDDCRDLRHHNRAVADERARRKAASGELPITRQ